MEVEITYMNKLMRWADTNWITHSFSLMPLEEIKDLIHQSIEESKQQPYEHP